MVLSKLRTLLVIIVQASNKISEVTAPTHEEVRITSALEHRLFDNVLLILVCLVLLHFSMYGPPVVLLILAVRVLKMAPQGCDT